MIKINVTDKLYCKCIACGFETIMRTNDGNFSDYIEKLSVKKKSYNFFKKIVKKWVKWFIKKIVFKGSSGKYIEQDIEKRTTSKWIELFFYQKFN